MKKNAPQARFLYENTYEKLRHRQDIFERILMCNLFCNRTESLYMQ